MHANVIVIEERPNLLSKSLDEDATLDTQQIRNSIEMVPYPRGRNVASAYNLTQYSQRHLIRFPTPIYFGHYNFSKLSTKIVQHKWK